MGNAKRITESVATPLAGCKVDRDAGTIAGVLVCGAKSGNGRQYDWKSGRLDATKYEGKVVNLNHFRDGRGERPVTDRIGWLSGIHTDSEGRPRGTLNVLKTHPMAPMLFEAAERNPSLFGLSHAAHCKTRFDFATNTEVVESIEEVESVDLVSSPATVRGLLESQQPNRRAVVQTTLRKFVESLETRLEGDARKRTRKFLVEADGDVDLAPVMDAEVEMPEMAEDTDPDAALWTGFQAAINSVLEQYATDKDAMAAIKAIAKYLKSHAKLASGQEITDAETDAEESAEEADYAEESLKKATKVVHESYASVFKVAGIDIDPDLLVVVAAAPEGKREEVARKLFAPARKPEAPKSAPVKVTESKTTKPADKPTEKVVPTDPAKHLEWLTGHSN